MTLNLVGKIWIILAAPGQGRAEGDDEHATDSALKVKRRKGENQLERSEEEIQLEQLLFGVQDVGTLYSGPAATSATATSECYPAVIWNSTFTMAV